MESPKDGVGVPPQPPASGLAVKRSKICVSPAITVREVIGYICWMYTREGHTPPLESASVDAYGLFLADYDGAVEYEMPNLEPNEVIAR